MSGSEDGRNRRPAALTALGTVLVLEVVGAVAIGLLALAASPGGGAVTSGIAVAVFVLILAALLAVVAVGAFRAQPWIRSAALVWQVVQALVGAYSLQGAGADVPFGLLAVGLALAGLVLLFSRPVRNALERA